MYENLIFCSMPYFTFKIELSTENKEILMKLKCKIVI